MYAQYLHFLQHQWLVYSSCRRDSWLYRAAPLGNAWECGELLKLRLLQQLCKIIIVMTRIWSPAQLSSAGADVPAGHWVPAGASHVWSYGPKCSMFRTWMFSIRRLLFRVELLIIIIILVAEAHMYAGPKNSNNVICTKLQFLKVVDHWSWLFLVKDASWRVQEKRSRKALWRQYVA